MMRLTAGENTQVPTDELVVRVKTGLEADISAFRLAKDGKVSSDAEMIFYGQAYSQDATLKLINQGVNTTFALNLKQMPSNVDKIAFTCTCQAQSIASLGQVSIQIERQGEALFCAQVEMIERTESALILGEFYRRNNEWKFRFISQGFNGGLKPLAEYYGVEVEDEKPASVSQSKVSLSKISLTKASPSVNLAKRDDFGLIKVNLNWHQNTNTQSSHFFSKLSKNKTDAIDLDLGCFFRLKTGSKGVIQALGNGFGYLQEPPYIQLLSDDRSGASITGEWLHINGKHWKDIEEVLIFAFIYEGVADWTKTDALVTLHVPNEPAIETHLTEGGRSSSMCAIARLINQNNTFSVERINRYFSGHKAMDQAFGWGFRWTSGSK